MEHIAGNAEALSKFVAKKPPESQRRFNPLAYSSRHRIMQIMGWLGQAAVTCLLGYCAAV
jgi:hypothetical protein